MKGQVCAGVALAAVVAVGCGSKGGGGSAAVVGFTGPAYVVTDASGGGTVPVLTARFQPISADASVAGCTAGAVSTSNLVATVAFTCPKIADDTSYSLLVQHGGAKDGATLLVQVAPDPAGTSLVGPASAIDPGAEADFSGAGCAGCTVTFAPPLTVDSGDPASGAFTGHLTTNPIATTTVSMLVVDQAGATQAKQAIVTVVGSSIVGFTGPLIVTSDSAGNGVAPVLTAQFNPASAVATVGGCVGGTPTGADPTTQIFTCAPLTAGTSYTLHVALGTVTETATHSVQVAADPSVTSLVGPAAAVDPGAEVDVSGVGCAGCTITFTPPVTLLSGSFAAAFTGLLSTAPTADTTVTMFVTNAAGASFTNEADVVVSQPQILGLSGPAYVTDRSGNFPVFTATFTPPTAVASMNMGLCAGQTPSGGDPQTQSFVCPVTSQYLLQVTLGTLTLQRTTLVEVLPDPSSVTALASTNSPIPAGTLASFSGTGCQGCAVTFEPPMTIDSGDPASGAAFTGHLSSNPSVTTIVSMFVVNAAGDSAEQDATVVVIPPDPSLATLVGPASPIESGAVAMFSGTGCAGCAIDFTPPMTIDGGSLSGAWSGHLTTNPTAQTTVSMFVTNGAGTSAIQQATVDIALFSTTTDYGVGILPDAIAIGDFNRDGHLDLATANAGPGGPTPGTASVLFGDGSGAFSGRLDLGLASTGQPSGVAVGDLNDDGSADLVVVGNFLPGTGNAAVALGDGAGHFGAVSRAGVNVPPGAVDLADVNDDGKLDLLIVQGTAPSTQIAVLLGTGTGTFPAETTFGGADGPRSLATGDFNHDGKVDVAAVDVLNELTIWNGNGAGSFTATQTLATDTGPDGIVVADFDGDGVPDLAEATAAGTVSIFDGNGDGSFPTTPESVLSTTNASALAVGDFNRDGNPDLAIVDDEGATTAGNVEIALGNGDGTFAPLVGFGVGDRPDALATGDFNEDGVLDLAVIDNGNNTVSVLLGH